MQAGKEEIKTDSPGKRVAFLGVMAALAALFQSAPVFLPGAGLMLSPFSTLPIAIGSLLYPKGALPMFLAAAGVISVIYVEEGAVFFFATGPLGLASSIVLMGSKPKWKKIIIPALILNSGILILTYVIGLPGLAEAVSNLYVINAMLAVFVFSVVYSCFWIYITLVFKKRLLLLIGNHADLSQEKSSNKENSDTI